ncbi:MAG: glutathione S-transferase family protein [Pseudomonadales bacterium]|nr:glutathione S-transferase family protein [Pseudomonadales bacterium]
MEQSLELVSFKTCPFVQRSVITLAYKDIPFKVTYIDLANPPDWFSAISPLGKVPVLKVGNETLFESAVINEYIDDISGGQLQSETPLEKAKDRAWIEVASSMLGNDYYLKVAIDKAAYEQHRDALALQFHRLEAHLGEGPWFNGSEFSLVDTAFAPLFTHQNIANARYSVIDPTTMPKVVDWSERLLSLPCVQESTVTEFGSVYLSDLEEYGSYGLQA